MNAKVYSFRGDFVQSNRRQSHTHATDYFPFTSQPTDHSHLSLFPRTQQNAHPYSWIREHWLASPTSQNQSIHCCKFRSNFASSIKGIQSVWYLRQKFLSNLAGNHTRIVWFVVVEWLLFIFVEVRTTNNTSSSSFSFTLGQLILETTIENLSIHNQRVFFTVCLKIVFFEEKINMDFMIDFSSIIKWPKNNEKL